MLQAPEEYSPDFVGYDSQSNFNQIKLSSVFVVNPQGWFHVRRKHKKTYV